MGRLEFQKRELRLVPQEYLGLFLIGSDSEKKYSIRKIVVDMVSHLRK